MSTEDSISFNDENLCIICLEDENNNTKSISIHELNFQLFIKECDCIYIVHPLCIMTWLSIKPECPMCRGDISTPMALLQDIDTIYLEPPIQISENVELTHVQQFQQIIYNHQIYYIQKWIVITLIILLLLIFFLLFQ
jgi:hypothetical protein